MTKKAKTITLSIAFNDGDGHTLVECLRCTLLYIFRAFASSILESRLGRAQNIDLAEAHAKLGI